MRPIFISIGLLFACLSVQAVKTKNCPESLKVNLGKFEIDDFDFENFEDRSDFIIDGYNDVGIYHLINRLKKEKSLKLNMKLVRKSSGKCHYEGKSSKGKYARARLEGSTREGAARPAVLVVYTGDLVAYLRVSRVTKTKLYSPSKLTGLYYNGEYCSWGECITDHIQIGFINSVRLK